jgi:hypothetical protein
VLAVGLVPAAAGVEVWEEGAEGALPLPLLVVVVVVVLAKPGLCVPVGVFLFEEAVTWRIGPDCSAAGMTSPGSLGF